MTPEEMDAIIKTDAGGEVTYRDRKVFLAAVEWAACECDDRDADHLRAEVAQLG